MTGFFTDVAVPHCAQHCKRTEAYFLMRLHEPGSTRAAIECYGLGEDFIRELWTNFTHGDIHPPWKAIPREPPDYRWGKEQHPGFLWREVGWKPFWRRLSPPERIRYVERWNPPAEWRDAFFSEDGDWSVYGSDGETV